MRKETMEKTPMEEAYSEYVMGGYSLDSFAEYRGITPEEARDLIAIGRRLFIENTERVG